MNKELELILLGCRRMAKFLSEYSLGNIKEQALELVKKIDKYIEEEKMYGEDSSNTGNNISC